MAYLRPGVYVEENLNLIPPLAGPDSTSVAAFIGATDKGPVEPTLVTSWTQYTSLFGSWGTNNKVTTAVYLYFANGGNQAYIQRVVDAPTAETAERTFNDRGGDDNATLTLAAKNAGEWGNAISITISDSALENAFDVTVFYQGVTAGSVVERFTDLVMDPTASRYAPTVINAASIYITATDEDSPETGGDRNPAATAVQPLAGGDDGDAITESDIANAVTAFDPITNSLILNAPGVVGSTAVNLLISYAEGRDDVFVVIDGIDDTVANQLTRADSYTASSLAAVYYPNLTIPNPQSSIPGATVVAPVGAAVVGKFVQTDASRGVFKAPAGLTTRISGAVSVAKLSNDNLDALNSASAAVNAVRFIPGSGIVIMGSRTLKAGYVDRYVPVRRTLIYLRKSLVDLTEFAVFEPNDQNLWRQITATVESFLTSFWQQGGLRGATPSQAFFVKCDAETNPLYKIDNGEVNIEVGVALQRPAEFVIIKIGQYDGGATVTVA
jgi:phage tail sheath protein FI